MIVRTLALLVVVTQLIAVPAEANPGSATLEAKPQPIEQAIVRLSQATRSKAVTKLQFGCGENEDLAECLGAAVRLPYLPEKSRVRLTVAVPSRSGFAVALVAKGILF